MKIVWYLIFSGAISLLGGVLFLCGKDKIAKLSSDIQKTMNKRVETVDPFFVKNNVGTGVSLLVISIYLFFIAYYVYVKMQSHGLV
jgi:hypothetical protein